MKMESEFSQQVTIREMRPEDALAFLTVRRDAVRAIPDGYYSADIVEAWAPPTVSPERVMAAMFTPTHEFRLVAEARGKVVGMGVLDLVKGQVLACYVSPEAGGQGVGSSLLQALEAKAQASGLHSLTLDASLNAELFYARHGFVSSGRGSHLLGSRIPMPCIHMAKSLAI